MFNISLIRWRDPKTYDYHKDGERVIIVSDEFVGEASHVNGCLFRPTYYADQYSTDEDSVMAIKFAVLPKCKN